MGNNSINKSTKQSQICGSVKPVNALVTLHALAADYDSFIIISCPCGKVEDPIYYLKAQKSK